MSDLCEAVITAPDPDWLLGMTRRLVAEGLCASVHHFSPVRSIYRWRGEMVERIEGRASLHTRTVLVEQIVNRVKSEHRTRYQEYPHVRSLPETRITSAGYATRLTEPTVTAEYVDQLRNRQPNATFNASAYLCPARLTLLLSVKPSL